MGLEEGVISLVIVGFIVFLVIALITVVVMRLKHSSYSAPYHLFIAHLVLLGIAGVTFFQAMSTTDSTDVMITERRSLRVGWAGIF